MVRTYPMDDQPSGTTQLDSAEDRRIQQEAEAAAESADVDYCEGCNACLPVTVMTGFAIGGGVAFVCADCNTDD